MSFTKRAIKEGTVTNENMFNDTGMLSVIRKDLWRLLQDARLGSRQTWLCGDLVDCALGLGLSSV